MLFRSLVTYGGDPHAAFKITRYIQDNYDHFTLFVPGFCKSAGTLFAIAANEIVFAPFGELGPLDVQMAKPDQFQFDSGLVIGESLDTLERRAAETFKRMFHEVMTEPPRVCRRPQLLRGWGHDKQDDEQVFS